MRFILTNKKLFQEKKKATKVSLLDSSHPHEQVSWDHKKKVVEHLPSRKEPRIERKTGN